MLAALRSTVKRLLRSKRTSAKNEPNKSREEQDERQTKRIRTQHTGRVEETDARLTVTKPLGNQKRLAGRLAMKVLMLDDIFFEIAHYLGPDDLLRMSRSSKALRGLLMSKNSKLIWRAAEKAVELPKCPSDLSSPQYASFVFDKYCTHCLYSRAHKRMVAQRIRLCRACTNKTMQKTDFWMWEQSDMPSNKEECLSVFMLVPGFSKDPSVLSREGEIIEALDISDLRSFTFYFPQVEAALKKYMSFGGDCQQRREFLDAGHEASRQKYLSAPALNRWLEDAKAAKTKNAQWIRKCRKDSIVNKLINIGYSPEDLESNIDQNGWKWSNLIDQPRPLTERIWENIRPQLEETIRLRREKKIELEKKLRQRKFGHATKELLYSRGSAPEDYYIVPSELLELPLAKQLFESDQVWTEIPEAQQSYIKQYAIERSNARLLKLEVEGASAIVRARREAGVPAINTIASNSSEPNRELTRNEETKTQDILQHPTTFFTIWEYGNQCLYTFSEMLEELAKHCFSELHYFHSTEPFQWALGTASYNGLRYADALYLDLAVPGSKTMDDMEALGNTFVCLRCHPTCREMKSWRNLVNHFYIEYKDYAEREAEKQRHVNCKIVNVHDHDQNDPAPLAAYVGTDATLRTVNSATSPASPDSSQFYEEILFGAAVSSDTTSASPNSSYDLEKSIWIWPCECVGHNGRKHLRLTCRECVALGIFDYRSSNFACQGKLDEHRRAKHRVGQVAA